MLSAGTLRHGGIMANYQCTAACRHCLYACSPKRGEGYISKPAAEDICGLLLEGGCRSVHIGGGEPFMNFDGLLGLIETVTRAGISVEYIETNAFWAVGEDLIQERLRALSGAGADTLCISLDPFHAEYVPVERPLLLAQVCQKVGFGFFLWQDRFLPLMSGVDFSRAHSREELERSISPDYVLDTAESYGIRLGGRAVNIEAEYAQRRPAGDVADSRPCAKLLSTNHFHVDLYGRFIPPGCTGIAIPLDEAVRGIPDGKYPAFEALLSGGPARLLEYARTLGFTVDERGYPSSCALCFHIRHWLCGHARCPELDAGHYEASLTYY